ncbi:YggT family protein [Cellulomonas bogoriensis]|uniref:Membrane protein n=1 Tax=Cellulomonas bogoriensis 69B4 = DSM 16987 TaxID=1386082 RepID=A0A0A0BQ66_9CELL|nr:YggT family protein [Cellulomonas bogoriensis]KGM09214.1 membrane protein [Cellulomonas bogoriensis 69B4 = DSM 16987]
MALVFGALYWVVLLFLLLMLVRLVFEWVQVFAREWRPRGIVLVVAEAAYTVTDPPIRAVRRVVPPLGIGGIRLDLGFIIVMFAGWILLNVLQVLA